jgi:hypothetical protein
MAWNSCLLGFGGSGMRRVVAGRADSVAVMLTSCISASGRLSPVLAAVLGAPLAGMAAAARAGVALNDAGPTVVLMANPASRMAVLTLGCSMIGAGRVLRWYAYSTSRPDQHRRIVAATIRKAC